MHWAQLIIRLLLACYERAQRFNNHWRIRFKSLILGNKGWIGEDCHICFVTTKPERPRQVRLLWVWLQ